MIDCPSIIGAGPPLIPRQLYGPLIHRPEYPNPSRSPKSKLPTSEMTHEMYQKWRLPGSGLFSKYTKKRIHKNRETLDHTTKKEPLEILECETINDYPRFDLRMDPDPDASHKVQQLLYRHSLIKNTKMQEVEHQSDGNSFGQWNWAVGVSVFRCFEELDQPLLFGDGFTFSWKHISQIWSYPPVWRVNILDLRKHHTQLWCHSSIWGPGIYWPRMVRSMKFMVGRRLQKEQIILATLQLKLIDNPYYIYTSHHLSSIIDNDSSK